MLNQQPINVDDSVPLPPERPINIDDQTAPPTLSQGVVDSRSMKAYLGLGSIVNKSYDDIQADIGSGRESDLRNQASATMMAQNAANRQKMVMALMHKTEPITPEDAQAVFDPNAPHNKFIDPKSVVEKAYGRYAIRNTLEEARRSMGDTSFDEVQQTVPKSADDALGENSVSVAKREFALTQLEDSEGLAHGQSALEKLYHGAISWGTFGLADQFRLAGLHPMGDYMQQQAARIRMLPFDEYKDEFVRIKSELDAKDPELGKQFAASVVGMSSADIALRNYGTLITLATAPGVGLAGKAALRAAGLINYGRTAAGTIAEATTYTGPPHYPLPVVLKRAAGDLKDAAVEQVSDSVKKEAMGVNDPIKDSLEALPTALKTGEQAQLTPGKAPGLGQDLVNRINENKNTDEANMYKVYKDVSKVQRISEFLGDKQAIRNYIDYIRQFYTGPHSTIGDITGPFTNAEGTGHFFKVQMLRHTGEAFSSIDQAVSQSELMGIVPKPPPEYLEALQGRIKALEDVSSSEMDSSFASEAKLAELRREYERISGGDGFEIRPITGYKFNAAREVEQQGLGYYIERIVPVNETSPLVTKSIATTLPGRTPFTLANMKIGQWRTGKETESELEKIRKEAATYGPNAIFAELDKITRKIRIPYKYQDDFNKFLDFARTDRDGEGKQGYFKQTIQEIEDYYLRYVKDKNGMPRAPTPAEVEAYFRYTGLSDLDHKYRSQLLLQLKHRWGAEQHSISFEDARGNKHTSPFFEGRILKAIPGGDAGVAFVGRNGLTYRYITDLNQKARDELIKNIEQGTQHVVQIYDTEKRPFRGFGNLTDEKVEYVVTDLPPESKPLSLQTQLPYRGGGHVDYAYEHMIKQAKIRREKVGRRIKDIYEGDATGFPIALRAMGEKLIPHLDEVGRLLKEGKVDEAKLYNEKNLPVPWEEHHGWYLPHKNPVTGEIEPPRFTMGEPFRVVPLGKTIADMDKEGLERRFDYINERGEKKNSFVDGTKEGNPARQMAVKYTGERDAFDMRTFNDIGSRGNPVWSYEPAKLVDPIPTLNRALSGIINSLFMDNVKIAGVQSWLKEASNWLDHKDYELEHSPMYYFRHHVWKSGTPEDVKRLLESNRMKLEQFVGIPSKWDTALHSLAQDAADQIYGKAGPKITPIWAVHMLRDPFQFIRSVIFTDKLGLFNPASFFTQAMTHVNVIGMAGPVNATKGLFATLLHQYSRFNSSPEILDHLDKLATRMGWKPGEWLEARDAMMKSGFFHIGPEYSLIDNVGGNKLIQSRIGRILDFSHVFFREGAQNTRGTSWFAAWKEFRDLHPTGRVTEDELGQIRRRASIFDHNMNRSANNILNTGVMSIPGQFLTYHKNLVELMTGKQLTRAEKMRMFATNALIYGLPGGFALYDLPGSNINPLSEDNFKQTAEKYGYRVGNNFVSDILMHGLPAWMMYAASGHMYNVEEKWGPGNYDTLNAALDGSKPFYNYIGGASFSTIANIWAASSDYRRMAHALITGNSKEYSPPKLDDFMKVFAVASSTGGTLQKIIVAINTGDWYSVNGTLLETDVGKWDAITRGITGLQSHFASEPNIQMKIQKANEENWKMGERHVIQDYQKMIMALRNRDPEQAQQYLSSVQAWFEAVKMPMQQRAAIIDIANQSFGVPLKEKLDYSLLRLKNAPPGEEAANQRLLMQQQQEAQKKRTQ